MVAVCGWQRLAHAQLVEPLAGPAYELKNEAKAAPVEVPLTLGDQVTLKGVIVNRVDAGDRQQPSLLPAFNAALDGSTLRLAVAFSQVHVPRTYKLWLELSGNAPQAPSGTALAKQLLNVELVLPPARLEPIAPFVVTHEQWPWGTCQGKEASFQLPLHETTGQTSLSGLWIEQEHPVLNDDRQVPTRLVADTGSTELAAGARRRVTVHADDVGVGTTKGNLVIAAEQLSEPMKVPFEIRTKIFDVLIIPWYLFFGWIGWVVRIRLQQASQRAELRVQSDALRKRADTEIASNPDDANVVALKAARSALDEALRQDDNQLLQKAVAELRSALEDAHKKRAELVAQALALVAQQETELSVAYDLPEGLTLDRARELTGLVRQQLLNDRPREAKQVQSRQRAELDKLGDEIDRWSRAVRASLEAFEAGANEEVAVNVPSAAREDATKLLTSLLALLQKAEYSATKPPAALGEYLSAVSDANRGLAQFFVFVKNASANEMNAALQAYREVDGVPPAIQAAVAALPQDVDDVTATQLGQLAAAMRDFSHAVAKSLTDSESKDMARAGRMAAAIKNDQALGQGVGGAKISDSESEPAPSSVAPSLREKPLRATAAAAAIWERAAAPELPAVSELRTIQTTRSLVSAAILSVIAWMVYRTSWVGTVSDFAGIAAVAFFTDFTLDAVLEAVAKVKKPAQ
ncbi:MAG TPA: hypothetical protein VHB79_22520 [Polyangiaceae bacterium]|nr:hypothetical protein [Polyangiaceae bacterium]